MICPHDGSEMEKRKYEGLFEIDYCNTCHGIWLDPQELEAIQEIKVNDYKSELKQIPDYVGSSFLMSESRDNNQIVCPRCSSVMERKEYGYCSQVYVDYCINGHGIWLDEGELKDLELFYERSRHETREIRGGFFRGLLDLFR
jgi:hypothetical protein